MLQPAPASVKHVKPSSKWMLGKVTPDINTEYSLGKVLGKGHFGVTRLATHKATGKQYACKSISKAKLVCPEDVADVQREVQIMNHLSGHANVVTIKGVYEDKSAVHIVMELCAGGELFDRIIAKGRYTEKDAAGLIRTMLQVRRAARPLTLEQLRDSQQHGQQHMGVVWS